MVESRQLDLQRRIRWILYGEPGCGKTFTWLDILVRNPKMYAYVIDPDDGVEDTLAEFDKGLLDRIIYYPVSDFHEIKEAFKKAKELIKPKEDMIVLEQGGQLWDMAQQTYVTEVFNKDIGDYFVEMRRALVEAKKTGGDAMAKLDGWKDWAVIKKLHNLDFMEIATKRLGCHVVMTSAAIPVDIKKDDAIYTSIFSEVGFRPEGEKHNAYRVSTILFLSKRGRSEYYVEAVKNRGREVFGRTKIPKGQTAFDVFMKHETSGSGVEVKKEEVEDKVVDGDKPMTKSEAEEFLIG